jgi:eukaryotic-like serine/threonine-protein kinase
VRPVAPPTIAMPGPYLPGTPEGDLLPSERPYVAPLPPAPAQRSRRNGTRGVIILLVLLVVAAIIGGVLWFSGGGAPTAGGSPSAKRSASASTSAPASTAASAAAQTGSLPPSAPPSDAFPPQGATLCSGSTTVAVNATTSCEFADKVAAAIPPGSSGSFTVTANSPVTQKDYQMTCVRGSYTVCSGGVNAVVYVK